MDPDAPIDAPVDAPLERGARVGDARRRVRTAVYACAGAASVALAYLLWSENPSTSSWLPSCPFHALTGFRCPGCGATRATHALLHGDVAAAFAFNPLYVVAIPCVALWLALRGPRRLSPRAWVAMVALAVTWGVLRNVIHV